MIIIGIDNNERKVKVQKAVGLGQQARVEAV